ncbi:hypothetical protein [Luteipulveratus mongoliensis]|uniref:Glycosyltransferase RgtA/B/C/D-like domain-containing protein n=1 Tax=Luteipulveratus mongoliensis TaxID=571913 RepID=A0A0K1JNS1_9MICO|nr:hypothetical protein [Luteipulveratus mongoliensis]AKU18367.1 hypothetical protein VV02_25165 [Luteipulveratus mongoliensis]
MTRELTAPAGAARLADRRPRWVELSTRSWRGVPIRVWLLVALVTAPLVFFTARFLLDGWLPQGDEAIMAVRARDVWSSHPPLSGMRSTSGLSAPGVAAHHPGPMQFYVLAPLFALTGWWLGSLLVTSLLVTAGFAATAIVAAHRAAGWGAAVVAATVVLAMERLFGEHIVLPWNVWQPTVGLLAVLFLAWRLVLGQLTAMVPYVVCASYVAQGHILFLPVVGLVTASLTVIGLVRWRRKREAYWPIPGYRPSTRQAAWRRRGWITCAVVVLCWLPVLIETMVITPNNVHELLALGTSDEGKPKVGLELGLGFVLSCFVPLADNPVTNVYTHASALQLSLSVLVVVLAVLTLVLPRAYVRRCRLAPVRPGVALGLLSSLPVIWMASSVREELQIAYSVFAIAAALLVTGLVAWWLYRVGVRYVTASVRGVPVAPAAAGVGIALVLMLVSPSFLSGAAMGNYDGDVDRAARVTTAVRSRIASEGLQGRAVAVEVPGRLAWFSLGSAVTAGLTVDGHQVYFDVLWGGLPQDDDHRRLRNAPTDAVKVIIRDRVRGEAWNRHPVPPHPTAVLPFTFVIGPQTVDVEVLIQR